MDYAIILIFVFTYTFKIVACNSVEPLLEPLHIYLMWREPDNIMIMRLSSDHDKKKWSSLLHVVLMNYFTR